MSDIPNDVNKPLYSRENIVINTASESSEIPEVTHTNTSIKNTDNSFTRNEKNAGAPNTSSTV